MKNSTLLEFETRSDRYLNHLTSPDISVSDSYMEEDGTFYVTELKETINLPVDVETLYRIQPYT